MPLISLLLHFASARWRHVFRFRLFSALFAFAMTEADAFDAPRAPCQRRLSPLLMFAIDIRHVFRRYAPLCIAAMRRCCRSRHADVTHIFDAAFLRHAFSSPENGCRAMPSPDRRGDTIDLRRYADAACFVDGYAFTRDDAPTPALSRAQPRAMPYS